MSLAQLELNVREVPLQRRYSMTQPLSDTMPNIHPYAATERYPFTVHNRAAPHVTVSQGRSQKSDADFFRTNTSSGGSALISEATAFTATPAGNDSVPALQSLDALSRVTVSSDEDRCQDLSPAVGLSGTAVPRSDIAPSHKLLPTASSAERIEVDSRRSISAADSQDDDDDLHDDMAVDGFLHANVSRRVTGEASRVEAANGCQLPAGYHQIDVTEVEKKRSSSQQAHGTRHNDDEEIVFDESQIGASASRTSALELRRDEEVAYDSQLVCRSPSDERFSSPQRYIARGVFDEESLQIMPAHDTTDDDFYVDGASPLRLTAAKEPIVSRVRSREPTDGSTPTPTRITLPSGQNNGNWARSPGRDLDLHFASAHPSTSPVQVIPRGVVQPAAIIPISTTVVGNSTQQESIQHQRGLSTQHLENNPSGNPIDGLKVITSGRIEPTNSFVDRETTAVHLMMQNLEQQMQKLNERENRAGELLQSALEEGRRVAELQKENQNRELELAKKERDLMDQYKDFEQRVDEWKLKEKELQRMAASKAEETDRLLKFTRRLRLLTTQSRAATISGNAVRSEMDPQSSPYSTGAPTLPVTSPELKPLDTAAESKPSDSADVAPVAIPSSGLLLGLIAFCFALSGAMFGILALKLGF